jgi:phenylacetate-CoA ligase
MRSFYNGVRGLVGVGAVLPLAERWERRNIRSKQAWLAAEMSLPFADRRRHSWNRLLETVWFAGATVPYYIDLFASIGFDSDKLTRDPAYLSEIPPLTKEIIREQGDRMLRRDHADYRKHICRTGGSTGPSTNITYDQSAADWSSAVTRYARSLIGAGSARSQLHLAADFAEAVPLRDRLREQIKCLANNRFNLTFATFGPDQLDAIWQRIKRVNPYLLHGHPSTLYHLALHLEERGLTATRGRPFSVFESSGELISNVQQDVIERVFGCRVVNRYGLAEAGVVAYQAEPECGDMLVFDPVVWPETAEACFAEEVDREACGPGGELLVSTLMNRVMPLLRYRTGDIGSLRETSEGFRLQALMGRLHDVIEIDGESVPTHHIQDFLDRTGGVREFQIEAGKHNAVFRIVPEEATHRDRIERTLRKRWTNGIEIEFVGMDALKRLGWRSKFRHLVVSAAAE